MSQPVAVRMDHKGRLTVPRELREKLGMEAGDLFFLEQEGNILRVGRADNPFDLLAEQARSEYHAGKTRELRSLAQEHGLPLDGE